MTAPRRIRRLASRAVARVAGRWSVVVAAIALAAAGTGIASSALSGDGTEGAPTAGSGPPVVDCESRDQLLPARRSPGRVSRRLRKRSIVAGPVMFMGAKNWGDPRAENSRAIRPRGARGGRLQPTKIPFLVDAGRPVVVSVHQPAGRRAKVSVGNAEGPPPWVVRGRRVELRPCLSDARVAGRRVGKRTPFTGGFRVDGPMCLRVAVEVEGRERPMVRRIGFGKRPGCTPRLPGPR